MVTSGKPASILFDGENCLCGVTVVTRCNRHSSARVFTTRTPVLVSRCESHVPQRKRVASFFRLINIDMQNCENPSTHEKDKNWAPESSTNRPALWVPDPVELSLQRVLLEFASPLFLQAKCSVSGSFPCSNTHAPSLAKYLLLPLSCIHPQSRGDDRIRFCHEVVKSKTCRWVYSEQRRTATPREV